MSTITTAVEVDAVPEIGIQPEFPIGRSVAGVRDALLKWIRGVAWRVLDMETEFEALD